MKSLPKKIRTVLRVSAQRIICKEYPKIKNDIFCGGPSEMRTKNGILIAYSFTLISRQVGSSVGNLIVGRDKKTLVFATRVEDVITIIDFWITIGGRLK